MSGGPGQIGGDAGGGGPSDRWVRAFQQLFDPHPSHVALVGLDGTVLAVNAAWDRYARASGVAAGYEFVGRNYLAVCESAVVGGEAADAREAYVGLLDVLRNGRPKFTMTYACHSPSRQEWYRMWVEPQTPAVAAVIVAHQLVESKPWAVGALAAGGVTGAAGAVGVFDAGRAFRR